MPKKNDGPPTGIVPAGSVVITPPIDKGTEENSEALDQIAARMEAIETRITQGLEGERLWTTETITSLQTELQSLKETLQSLTADSQSMTQGMALLRDELIQQLREAREKLASPPEPLEPPISELSPPPVPPEEPPPEAPEGQKDQQKLSRELPTKKGKRVI